MVKASANEAGIHERNRLISRCTSWCRQQHLVHIEETTERKSGSGMYNEMEALISTHIEGEGVCEERKEE